MTKTTARTLTLDEELRQAIRESFLPLNQIEKRCGVSHAVLSRFMRGQRTMTLALASRLCDLFNLHLCKREGGTEAVAECEGKASPAPPKRGRKAKGKQAT
jgi:hypothetical protein